MKNPRLLILGLMILSGAFNYAWAQQDQSHPPVPGTEAYQIAKETGQLDGLQIQSIPVASGMENGIIPISNHVAAHRVNGCYIPHDTATYTMLPRNDDGSSSAIALPFTFDMYGTAYNTIYVNNNGNITFNSGLSSFTASGFPITTPMIAPFWADVDTRGSGSDAVWYKVTSTALYVNYPSVGYFPNAYDKLNTFQVIITDGNDPVIGIGNNVAFYYEDMAWTTGSASGGTNGFGGSPATVGVNSGDNVNFFQIGRFVQSGSNFSGAYDLDGGVDWLDGKCFEFSVNSESDSNIPPLLLNISATSVTICEGESSDINFTFTGPESDQEVSVSLNDPGSTGSVISSTTVTADATSGVLSLTGAAAGTYNLQLIATDDGIPIASTTVNIELIVEECGFDCPQWEANIGDPCELPGDTGVLNADCECMPVIIPECTNFVYFLADHAAADGISTIYKITLTPGSPGTAVMDSIATSDIEVHIAYHGATDLIYAVSKHTNSYRTLTPGGVWGPVVSLGGDYGQITAAAFNNDGKLLIGSQTTKMIYIVDVNAAPHVLPLATFSTYSPIYGGDIAFASDGMMSLATRAGNALYEVVPPSNNPIEILPPKVTGMAITDTDELLISAQGQTALKITGGGPSYNLMLNGNPYTLRDGDMASGCNSHFTGGGECEDFTTFYVDHGPGIAGSNLYRVNFNGGNANMTYETNVAFEAHIGFDAANSMLYFVNADGSAMTPYKVLSPVPGDGMYLPSIPLTGPALPKVTAVIYNPHDIGYLYVGEDITGAIYKINVVTGLATYLYDAPVSGGDMAILNDGTIYLATRQGNALHTVPPVSFVGNIGAYVTGMARANDFSSSLILSNRSSGVFTKVGSGPGAPVITTYNVMLGGNPFTTNNGDMAAGCADNIPPVPPLNPIIAIESYSPTLITYPNPTKGPSKVVFTTGETTRTLIEVYDMNGRNIATLFNQEAQKGEEYTIDFNGSKLPNGVYIYRMTTNNETIIEKFMIAR